jgi:hypothetical protein
VNIEKVLFIGGNLRNFASVQIRCQDIAPRLGCDSVFSVKNAEEVPSRYSAFICVTACLKQEDIFKLAAKGPVIWDVIDVPPPKHGVSVYLTSTEPNSGLLPMAVWRSSHTITVISAAFQIHKIAVALLGSAI